MLPPTTQVGLNHKEVCRALKQICIVAKAKFRVISLLLSFDCREAGLKETASARALWVPLPCNPQFCPRVRPFWLYAPWATLGLKGVQPPILYPVLCTSMAFSLRAGSSFLGALFKMLFGGPIFSNYNGGIPKPLRWSVEKHQSVTL